MSTVVESITYPDLFERWEHNQWSAYDIDFSVDARQWRDEMTEAQRKAAIFNYSLFVHGEHLVAASLGPFIDAAPTPEAQYFLASQQADEARHAVFFSRFMGEVVGTDGTVQAGLEYTRPVLPWGFTESFKHLEKRVDALRKDPSLPNLAAGVAMYHLIVEATLAQPGQRMAERYLGETGLLPGMLEGMLKISSDEQRHIGFGVKLLSELTRDQACRDAVIDLLREIIPVVTTVFVPPGWDEKEYIEVFGFTMEDIYEEGMRSFESKLRAAGLPPESLHGAVPWPMDQTPRERAERAIALLRANTLGVERPGPASTDDDILRMHFETLALAVDDRHAPSKTLTVQWDFKDATPWYLRVEGGRGTCTPGKLDKPDVTVRCAFDDWIKVTTGASDPLRLMARGKMRMTGGLGSLRYLPKLFG